MSHPANDRRLAILQHIRQAGQLTRREIAQRVGLSLSLVSRLTAELLAQGLISEVGRSESDGGRPPDLLALASNAAYVVGLDIGGRRQRAIVADLRGAIVANLVESTPLSTEREAILANLEQLIDRVIGEAGLSRSVVMGLGIALRAIVDSTTGIVYGWPNTPAWSAAWTDFAVRDALAARLPWTHIAVDDTVRTLGVAEALYGHGIQQQDFVFVLADSGLGMAIMLGGAPYLGPSHIAGEIGHIAFGNASTLCDCGNTGCLETLSSTTAILARVRQRLAESHIRTMLHRSDREPRIEEVIDAAETGDKLAYQLLTEAGEYFGDALAIVLNLLGPKLVVVGGKLASSNVYLDAAWRMMKLRTLDQASRDVRVERSQQGELAGARGAASLVLDTLFSSGGSNILAHAMQPIPP
ncbi:MAG: ROK family transcriptional regulator [Roseiflexaceae bacterium]